MRLRERLKTLCQVKSIRQSIARASDIKIIVGASGTSYAGWIATDYPAFDIVREESWARLFEPGQIEAVLAEHVFEHLTESQAIAALANCHLFLRPGGHLRIAVPDGYHPSSDYIGAVKPGGHGLGSDDHKQLYNYKLLVEQITLAGFSAQLLEWFDESGNFNFSDWAEHDGFVGRSARYDLRNKNSPLAYTSLIIDARKS